MLQNIILKPLIITCCSDRKLRTGAKARDLYISERFLLSVKLCDKFCDKWYILSAKHGLIEPNTYVEPYDLSINDLDEKSRKNWSHETYNKIISSVQDGQHIIFIGEPKYFDDISDKLRKSGIETYIPFKHIKLHFRVQWLLEHLGKSGREKDIKLLYSLLFQPKIKANFQFEFSKFSKDIYLPRRGIYIFTKSGDYRILNSKVERIIRVGTHAVSNNSKSTLRQRLMAHKGKSDGSGNHRASIFRLHIGSALISKNKFKCDMWGEGQVAPRRRNPLELEIEHFVSDYMSDMSVLFLPVEDKPSKYSDRAYLEQNLIALLAGPRFPLDIAHESWLGFYCQNRIVRLSSIWNVDHTNKDYDSRFLDVLERYINSMKKGKPQPQESMAPQDWWNDARSNYKQLKFTF